MNDPQQQKELKNIRRALEDKPLAFPAPAGRLQRLLHHPHEMSDLAEQALEGFWTGEETNRALLLSRIRGAIVESGCALMDRLAFKERQNAELHRRVLDLEGALSNANITLSYAHLCNCTCGDVCPLGKTGMGPRCSMSELRGALEAQLKGAQ